MSTNVHETSAVSPAVLPDLEPIPCIPRALPFDDPGWVFQPRHEGLRGLVVRTRGGCEIRSARELRPAAVQDLAERIAAVMGEREAVLDGDVVALDRQGRPSFGQLLRGRTLLAFAAFDLLWLDGKDVRGSALSERQRMLGDLVRQDTGPLYKVFLLEEHGRALFQAARRLGLEGIVARRKQDPYGPGTVWYSIRNPSYTRDDGRIDPFRARPRARRPEREGAGS